MAGVTFIVHGCVWPDEAAVDSLRSLLHAAEPGAEILHVTETWEAPRGAAHAINVAAARAFGDVLVVCEPFTPLNRDTIGALVQSARNACVVAAGREEWAPGPPLSAATDDLLAWLDREPSPRAQAYVDLASRAMPAWGMPRRVFEEAGRLDERLWSVGLLADLEARLAARFDIAAARPVETRPRAAWPLRPNVATWLAARARLIIALKTLPPDELGIELADAAVGEIRRAWQAAGLAAKDFHFGGSWGRGEGTLARVWRPGAKGASRVANPARVLPPLLTLDSVLDLLPALAHERKTLLARARVDGPSNAALAVTQATAEEAGPEEIAVPDGSAARPTPLDELRHPNGVAAPTDANPTLPAVSVIVVNWNGREHLTPCFESLLASDYPADRLELVCVDNGSTDGSVALLRQSFPRVLVVALPENRGFTGGNSAGVAAATGEVLVFLNNDMRVEPDAIRRLVAALDERTTCVAARVPQLGRALRRFRPRHPELRRPRIPGFSWAARIESRGHVGGDVLSKRRRLCSHPRGVHPRGRLRRRIVRVLRRCRPRMAVEAHGR